MVKEKRNDLSVGNGAVIGGGISGLALGILLQRAGYAFRIFERSDSMALSGHAIWLYPNALRVLDRLDVLSSVLQNAHPVSSMEYCDASFTRFMKLPLTDFRSRFGYPVVVVMRGQLHKILADALGEGKIDRGKKLTGLFQNENMVQADFADSGTEEFSWLVGADGINSSVREALYPRWRSRFTGQSCWLGTSAWKAGPTWNGRTVEAMGRGARLVFTQTREGYTAWSALVNSDRPEMDCPRPLSFLRYLFRDFSGPVAEILEAAHPESLHQISLREVPPHHPWHTGSVCLLGDAAHGMTPNLGQGAAQGLEDAWHLSQCLRESENPADAFQRFYQQRHRKVRSLVRMSGFLGKTGGLQNSLLAGVRDRLLPLLPVGLSLHSVAPLYRGPAP